MALLARCAAAVGHPDRHVREAAVQCAQACVKLVQAAGGGPSGVLGARPRLVLRPACAACCARS